MTRNSDAYPPTMPSFKCPICGRQFAAEQTPAMPFCSDRCKQIDLGRWLDEGYSLPHVPDEDESIDAQG